VASFIGKANLFDSTYIGNNKIKFFDEIFKISETIGKRLKPHTPIKFMIRPEDIYFVEHQKGIINGRVIESIYKGQTYSVQIKCKNYLILAETLKPITQNQLVGLD
jgi:spermidine/putrescine transport system ATP-binding protein